MLFLDKLTPKTRSLVIKHSDFTTNRPSNQIAKYADVKSSLLEIFKKGSINLDTALAKFIDRNQFEGESVITFYITLHSLAKKAKPNAKTAEINEMVGNRFINGIQNDALSNELEKHLDSMDFMGRRNKAAKYQKLLQYA